MFIRVHPRLGAIAGGERFHAVTSPSIQTLSSCASPRPMYPAGVSISARSQTLTAQSELDLKPLTGPMENMSEIGNSVDSRAEEAILRIQLRKGSVVGGLPDARCRRGRIAREAANEAAVSGCKSMVNVGASAPADLGTWCRMGTGSAPDCSMQYGPLSLWAAAVPSLRIARRETPGGQRDAVLA